MNIPRGLEQLEDVVTQDHEDDVENPDDVPAQENTQKRANPMAFLETGDESQDPRSDGNDAEDQTNDPAQPKIILTCFTCHVLIPPHKAFPC